jgi:hypothetical protein
MNRSLGTSHQKPLRDKFWVLVEPNRLRLVPPGDGLFQHTDEVLCRERRINLNRQAFPHPFIQHIERPESPVAAQGVTHELHSPDRVRLRDHDERTSKTNRESLLRPSGDIQAERTVHLPQPLRIPRMTISSEPITTPPEAPVFDVN